MRKFHCVSHSAFGASQLEIIDAEFDRLIRAGTAATPAAGSFSDSSEVVDFFLEPPLARSRDVSPFPANPMAIDQPRHMKPPAQW